METSEIIRSILALIFVVGLILGCAALARQRGWLQGAATGGAGRRLAVTESLGLDPRHRLLLVRVDDAEHLVLLGPSGATLHSVNTKDIPPDEAAA